MALRRLLSSSVGAVVGRAPRKAPLPIVMGRKYFNEDAMRNLVAGPNVYLMSLSSLVGMYIGTYVTDYLFYDIYVRLRLTMCVLRVSFSLPHWISIRMTPSCFPHTPNKFVRPHYLFIQHHGHLLQLLHCFCS